MLKKIFLVWVLAVVFCSCAVKKGPAKLVIPAGAVVVGCFAIGGSSPQGGIYGAPAGCRLALFRDKWQIFVPEGFALPSIVINSSLEVEEERARSLGWRTYDVVEVGDTVVVLRRVGY